MKRTKFVKIKKNAAPPKIAQALTSKGAPRRTGLHFTWSLVPWIVRQDFSFSEKRSKSNFRCGGCSKISAGQKSRGSKEKVRDWSTLTKTGRRIQFCIVALTFTLEQGNLLFILQLHTRLKSRYFFFNMKRVKNDIVEQNALSRNTQFSQKMIRFLSNLIAKVSKCQDLIFQQICPKKWFANFEQQSQGSDLITIGVKL